MKIDEDGKAVVLKSSLISRIYGWGIHFLFRTSLNLHALAVKCLGFGLRARSRTRGSTRSILLSGTFFSENWIMNHLRPIAASESCSRVWLVSTFPIPSTEKVDVIYPPNWLCRLIGKVPARLLMFTCVALRQRPDVVGGFHLLINGLLASLLARLVGGSSLYFCGGGPREVLGGGFFSDTRLFSLLRAPDPVLEHKLIQAVDFFDLVVTMGHQAKEFFRDHGVSSRIEVIPGGIDGRQYQSLEENRVYDLILVGRLVSVKRIDLFLKTVRNLLAEWPGISAVIVGSGELDASLKSLTKSFGIEKNVTFAGYQQDVSPWLTQSKVFILTSDSEGLSLALMEAMMSGLPCVVSDVGELGELVEHGTNGFLVKERSSRAFAHYIALLLRDGDQRAKLSAASRKTALRFDLVETTKKWDQVLREV